MAGFRAHAITGILSGTVAATIFLFSQCRAEPLACLHAPRALSICLLTIMLGGLGAMLPDVDSPRGRPLRLLFAVVAAMSGTTACLAWSRPEGFQLRFLLWSLGVSAAVFCAGSALFGRLTTHRGIFHSLPMAAAMVLWCRLFVMPLSLPTEASWLIALGGMGLGYLSHLLLDALASLGQSPLHPFKFVSKCRWATLCAYAFLAVGGLLNVSAVRAAILRHLSGG